MKLKLLGVLVLLCMGLGLLGAAYVLSGGAAPPAPGVLFILLDTVRTDRIDAERNGVPVAPFLSRLKEEAVYFERAYSPSSWTKPAMASIFTARHVDAHGVYHSARFEDPHAPTSDVLAPAFETLAEYLANHGYATRGIQTNANLTEALGFAQGYATEDYTFQNGYNAEWVTDQALASLEQLDQPLFLYAHYMDPHATYDPPAAYREPFGPLPELTATDQELLAPDRFMDYFFDQLAVALGNQDTYRLPQLSENGVEAVKLLYDAEIHYLDEHVRRLVERVRTDHPDTLIIITADHGEEFWERGGVGHGTTMYNELVHVPLWVLGPNIAPRRENTPVSLVGILPTIAAWLGLPARADWQAGNLLVPDATDVFSDTRGSWEAEGVNTEAVVRGDDKLIVDHAHGRTMLYDLSADPQERNDLSAARQDSVAALQRALADHRERNLASRAASGAKTEAAIDPEMVERLQALGYAGGDERPAAPAPEARPDVVICLEPMHPALAPVRAAAWAFTEAITPTGNPAENRRAVESGRWPRQGDDNGAGPDLGAFLSTHGYVHSPAGPGPVYLVAEHAGDAVVARCLDPDTLVVLAGCAPPSNPGRPLARDAIRVPLYIRPPGASARTVSTPVSLVDVAPTVAALAGLDPAGDWEGRSLSEPAKLRPAPVFSLAEEPRGVAVLLRMGPYALVAEPERESVLYNLDTDPEEMRDLAGTEEDLAARLNALLEEHLTQTGISPDGL